MVRVLAFVTALAFPALAAAQQPCTPDARRVVNELYRTMLERSADRSSDDFVQRLATGRATVREIVAEIARSPEHLQRFVRTGTSDADRRNAVTALYRHLLARQPDPNGLQAHMEGLRTEGVNAVIDSILDSPEYQERFGEQGVPGSQLRFCYAFSDTSTRLRPRFRNMDSNGDGRVTRSEWRGSARAFNNNDLNGDGILSGDEVTANRADRPVGTTGVIDDDDARRFDALDRNRNGRLERNEWNGSAFEFDRLDTNRNNLLSRAEASAAGQPLDEFDRLDRNNDGRLTLQEWNWNRRTFVQQDTNGDGVITAYEFRGRPVSATGF